MTGSTGLDFFLVSLAVWRVSSLFAREDGVFDIFLRFRLLIGVEFDKSSEEVGTNWLSKGVLCVLCSSVWFSAIGAFFLASNLWQWLVYLLALSAMAIVVDSVVNR